VSRLASRADERELLSQLVSRALSETRVEVRRTSTPDFHDRLQREEKRLERLLDRLGRPAAS
jgi:hypothetical protein